MFWKFTALAVCSCVVLAGCGSGETKTVVVTETVTAPQSGSGSDDVESSVEVGKAQTYQSPEGLEINGEPVDVKLEVRVVRANPRVRKPQFLTPQEGTRYVRATVTIRNTGEESYTPSAEFQAVTATGESSSFQSLGQPGDLGPATVRPGRTVRGRIWAEIPTKSKLQEIVFAPFGGDADTDLVWVVG